MKKEEPNKETLLAMYRSATQKVSDLNAHNQKKKQVRIDPVAEELRNFEQLNVEEEEFLDNLKPKDVFSETDSDQWKIGLNDCNIHKSKQYISPHVFALDNTLNSKLTYVSIRNHLNSQQPQKKLKIDHISSILFSEINIKHGVEEYNHIKILLDSGASSSIISQTFVKKLRQKYSAKTEWKTVAGKFKTNKQCNVTFKLSELNPTAIIQHMKLYVKTRATHNL